MEGNDPVSLTPDALSPVNQGSACPKGWEALAPLTAEDRGTAPLLKSPATGALEAVDWNTAATTFVERMKAIMDEHGPESVAFLGTGQIPTEELAFLGAFAKFGMGMVHGDGNTRQCMATAVRAYKESFGFDAPPYTYEDLELSDVLVFIGANPCIAHPIIWDRVSKNSRSPTIVVIDPRRTETAMAATQHIALTPKSDLVLFYILAKILIDKGWVNLPFVHRYCDGFEDFAAFVQDMDVEEAAGQCGLSAETVVGLARTIHLGRSVSFWWTMGVNQSHEGVRTAQAIINLALLTGNIGRPGTGANSITGQCNAMGSRLFSNTSSLFAGRSFTDANDRAEVAGILDIDEARIPRLNGWAYDQIVEGMRQKKIRALWIIATNPAHSWIQRTEFNELLGELDFLVVQDMFHSTETAQRADLFLPAAGWGEKEGTFINSERRIGAIRRVHRAPGQALSDFNIIRLLAEYWGCGEMFVQWKTPEDVFGILRRLSAGRPCDFSAISGYADLDEGGIQWPCTSKFVDTHRRLFEDRKFYRANGRAAFCFEKSRPAAEPVSTDYPLLLLSGRGSSSQWHTNTRTSKSPVLRTLFPEAAYIEIAKDDAERLGIKTGDLVTVSSRRGSVQVQAATSTHVVPGQVFMPMHYEATNRLTLAEFDPYSRQPSYKACAVAVRLGPEKG